MEHHRGVTFGKLGNLAGLKSVECAQIADYAAGNTPQLESFTKSSLNNPPDAKLQPMLPRTGE
jgi:hypothetical protein